MIDAICSILINCLHLLKVHLTGHYFSSQALFETRIYEFHLH